MKNLCVVELNDNRKGTRSNKAIPFPAFSCAATASNGHIDCYHMAVSYRFWVRILGNNAYAILTIIRSFV